ncbi:MAG: DUF4129 domain-containing protein [Halobacteriaceae archaeon]
MSVVDRRKAPSIVLIVVALLALSATAATIGNTVGGPTGGAPIVGEPPGGGGGGPGPGPGNGSGPGVFPGPGNDGPTLRFCIEFLTTPVAVVGLFGAMGALFYGVQRRWNGATALMVGSGVVPVVLGSYFFLTNCQTSMDNSGPPSGGPPSWIPGPGAGVNAPNIPPTVLGAALVAVLGLAAVMLYAVTGEDEEYEPLEDEGVTGSPDEADFAEAAGRAADRIEEANVAVDNAVYRAWFEMTQLLAIPDPDTSSPMDFADAAIDFGLDEDDVMELTDLFNEVRYGHEDPASREERALEILRHIESEYEADSE